jgi:hypothetical protein
MTITPDDVRTQSANPGPGGVSLPAAEVARIAAVLNRHTTPVPTSDPHTSTTGDDRVSP